ncbi:LGFP repeat-containing protein [Cellulomonas sp. URHD0024]|uniref:LGFP repeat-containing protein n=1 Tax=Cellulomonas sp. URHD0024 TaxID=1302620 RepID=UPI0012DFC4B1|nr:hypothetical protein [Cellulomonas sp. URHD0024]
MLVGSSRAGRRLARVGAIVALVVGIVGVGVPTAADASSFDPGYIISDGVFYDSTSMTAADIQRFLTSHNQGCATGFTCLYQYQTATTTKPADAYCDGYTGSSSEPANVILQKVARSCGVNPRVLLTKLQVESSLVTRVSPTYDNAYRKAMGYACPDTAPCDPSKMGFFNQVYNAARQFESYRLGTGWWYVKGGTYDMLYNPNRACGTGRITLRSQATAGLYLYTPYQPNAALLSGRPDGCSSYGNYNFWKIYTGWFGSTSFSMLEQFRSWYDVAANEALAGDPIANGVSVPGGVSQRFAHVTVYSSPWTGVQYTRGLVDVFYPAAGGPGGPLGFPARSPEVAVADGLSQDFVNGTLYIGPRGKWGPVLGWMNQAYVGVGGGPARMGFPVSGQRSVAGGLVQSFESGAIYVSGGSGAWPVMSAVNKVYVARGGPSGSLGFPKARQVADSGGRRQDFQGGRLYVGPKSSGVVSGWMLQAYTGVGGGPGSLGFPTGEQKVASGGIYQAFEKGYIYISGATGAVVVPSWVNTFYVAAGGTGALGYPTHRVVSVAGGLRQDAERGSVFIGPRGAWGSVSGWMLQAYLGVGGGPALLGFPTSSRDDTVAGGLTRSFEYGHLWISGSTGAWATLGKVDAAFTGAGGAGGWLGFPVGPQQNVSGGGVQQRFQHGTIVVPASGSAQVTRG